MPKPEYREAYFTTEPPPEGLPGRFGIVTAFNARGRSLPEEANRKADAQLRQHLIDTRLKHFRVTGGSRDGSHLEPGFGIASDLPDVIRTISNRFAQEAFFWVEDGVVFVVDTAWPTLHRLDDWARRQR